MTIKIDKLPQENWQVFKELRLEALKNDSIAFGSSFEEENEFTEEIWKERIKNVLFAYLDQNKKPIGLITYIINNRIKTKHIANIHSVYVKKEFRNKGIGKKLMEEAINAIKRDENVIKINLTVNPEQKSAVKLYEGMRFKPVGRLHKELLIEGKYYDEILMELFLQER